MIKIVHIAILAFLIGTPSAFAAIDSAAASSQSAASEEVVRPEDQESADVENAGNESAATEPAAGDESAENAESDDEILAETQEILDVDYAVIESKGLLRNELDGALKRNMWQNSRRSQITSLLQSMPAASQSPAIQKLIRGALLTEADASLLKNDTDPVAGEDILTLRLHKLIEGGNYRRAFELYSNLEQEPYHENLARAGVLAALYNGSRSSACLEAKAMQQRFAGQSFWDTMSAYCDVIVSQSPDASSLKALELSSFTTLYQIATDKSYRYTYTPESYGRLSTLEHAVIAAEGRLDVGTLESVDPDNIPPADLSVLLKRDDLTAKARLVLTIKAVEWGVVRPSALQEVYTSSFEPAAGAANSAARALPQNEWERLPYFYQASLRAQNNKEKLETLRQALPLTKNFGSAALTPMAQTITELDISEASPEDVLGLYRVLLTAGQSMPETWTETIPQIEPGDSSADEYATMLASGYINTLDHKKSEEQLENVKNHVKNAQNSTQTLLNNIIENIDIPTSSGHNAAKAYDKDVSLTDGDDYVIPSSVVWDRLKEAKKANAAAEAILLSIVLFGDQSMQNANPLLLRDALQSIENADFRIISRDMAAEALLGKL